MAGKFSTMSGSAISAYFAAALFLFAMILTFGVPSATASNASLSWFAGILWLAFHIVMFPVVAGLPAPNWAKASAYGWLVVDNVLVVANINGALDTKTTFAMRMGVHVAAAVWIAMASANGTTAFRAVGWLTALFLGGYSLIAPFVSPMVFTVAALLLLVWVTMCGTTLGKLGPHDEERGLTQPA